MPMRLSPSRRSSPCADIRQVEVREQKLAGPFGVRSFFMPKIRIALPKIAELMDFGLFPVAH
jgi:hypothetical protein